MPGTRVDRHRLWNVAHVSADEVIWKREDEKK